MGKRQFKIGDKVKVALPERPEVTGEVVHIIEAGTSPSEDVVTRFYGVEDKWRMKLIRRPLLMDRYIIKKSSDGFLVIPALWAREFARRIT